MDDAAAPVDGPTFGYGTGREPTMDHAAAAVEALTFSHGTGRGTDHG